MSAAAYPTMPTAEAQRGATHRLFPASVAQTQRSLAMQLDLKSVADNGEFEGYASLFNREDLGHDVISPGAFRDSLSNRSPSAVKMLFQHDPSQPIGVWDDLHEDAKGLYARGHLMTDVVKAREVLSLMRVGALDGLSIGFKAGTVRIKLSSGTLTSSSLLQVLAGVNAAAIQNSDGDWEVLQFLNAVLVDVATYDVSGFLRGQAGTETAMRASVAAGATFVLLDSAIARVPLALSELKLPFNWLCGPSNRPIGDPSYVATQHAFQGLGQRPLSPVRIKGARLAGGDLSIAWLRRTRIGGDSWELPDVPLSEDFERYELDVMAGAIVKRTIVTTSTTGLYTSAQQVADFGSQQASVTVRIQQMSALFGRGAARAATL